MGDTELMLILIGGGATFFLILLAIFMGGGTRRDVSKHVEHVRERIVNHADMVDPAGGSLRRKEQESGVFLINWVVRHLPSADLMRHRLERTGRNIPLSHYLTYCGLLFSGVTLALHLIQGTSLLLAGFIGIIVGIGIPHFITGRMAKKRTHRFLSLFPDAIDLIVRGLRAGLPIQEGFQVVSNEMPDPLHTEFADISERINLGQNVDQALLETAKRLKLQEFNFFVTSVTLQRETGGNLAEILENISEAIRGRYMMRMKIRALSSEARASAWIVGALPVVVSVALYFVSPGYLDVLWEDFRGNIALASAIGSLCCGAFIMYNMSKFEI